MSYCLVQKGVIVDGPRELPEAWGLIPNMKSLSQQELIDLGWFPHRIISVTGQHKMITATNFDINGNEVIETYTTRDMTEDEIASENEAHWYGVREARNRKLSESDYTQLPDADLTDAEKLNWASYRQALRDVTNQPDPNNILWPQVPGKAIGVAIL